MLYHTGIKSVMNSHRAFIRYISIVSKYNYINFNVLKLTKPFELLLN